jgi:uncharacterized protein YjaZ
VGKIRYFSYTRPLATTKTRIMTKTGMIFLSFLFIILLGCNGNDKSKEFNKLSFFDKIEKIPDSIKIDDIVVYNLFKYQILAHKNNSYDSTLIINKVYKVHPKIWKELYGLLFDKEMFTTEHGMIQWNKEIFDKNKDSIEVRVNSLLENKFDSKITANLKGIKELTGRSPENVRLSIILAPIDGIGFGGIDKDAFILDLLTNQLNVENMIDEGIPHEFNHFIYEPTRDNDPDKDTPLRLTIDEGFACYYTYKYFNGKISKSQAVEQMTDNDWNWYIKNEKEIYNKCSQYFYYNGDDDPLRNLGTEMNAPKTLFYWLGFRIIDSYVNKNGPDSWKDIYNLPVKEVLEKSGYEKYINELK